MNNSFIEILNTFSEIGIEVENKFYVVVDANASKNIEKYISLKEKFILILDSSSKIDSYLNDANPLAFDIIDLSEKPIVLVSSGAKNISNIAMQMDSTINIRIIREGTLQQIIRKYRKPLLLIELNDEFRSNYLSENCITLQMEDAFLNAGIIRLEANGRVEVLKP